MAPVTHGYFRPCWWFSLLVLVLALYCFSSTSNESLAAEQELSQEEAEGRLNALRNQIAALKKSLEQDRSDHRSEQEELKYLDLAIQETSRQLRELGKQEANTIAELERLEAQRAEQIQALQHRQGELSQQINATYRLATQSRAKLILNQDSAAQMSRMLAYYDHINRAQIEKINALKALLSELESIYERIREELSALKEVQSEQSSVLLQQQEQRGGRSVLVAALEEKINSSQAQLQEFERNRSDLEALIEKLNDVLSDIPTDLGKHLDVASQKGQLPMPVKGRVMHGFGQQRNAGMRWQGWLIEAGSGTEVSNIAYGRVAFADWLRGYGLLMIIDHGQGFMSLYGYNESLLWDVGDWVEPGEIIAVVGSIPGGEQGLYFEMRKGGKAVDPASWLKR